MRSGTNRSEGLEHELTVAFDKSFQTDGFVQYIQQVHERELKEKDELIEQLHVHVCISAHVHAYVRVCGVYVHAPSPIRSSSSSSSTSVAAQPRSRASASAALEGMPWSSSQRGDSTCAVGSHGV